LRPLKILDGSLSGQNFWSIEPHHDQNWPFLDFLLKPAQAKVPIHGQKCNRNHLRAKTFPMSPNMWRLVAWNLEFHADNGKVYMLCKFAIQTYFCSFFETKNLTYRTLHFSETFLNDIFLQIFLDCYFKFWRRRQKFESLLCV
jgi:hypothetical protein